MKLCMLNDLQALSKKRIGARPLILYPFREFLVLVAGVFWLFGGSLVRSTGVLVARKAVSFINIMLFFKKTLEKINLTLLQ